MQPITTHTGTQENHAMVSQRQKAQETARWIKSHIDSLSEIAIMTGTGLGGCTASLNQDRSFDYHDMPHFPISTVESHGSLLTTGTMGANNTPVMVFNGRFHLYEGYSPIEVTFPIRVMQVLGIRTLILTNAAGALNLSFEEGDIMMITDHINLTGENPLVGPNEDTWGKRFPDMIGAYDRELIQKAKSIGQTYHLPVKKGVYAGLKGPSLETPAEMKYLKIIGADAVGFSTIQEVIAAVHGNIRVVGLSIITNINDPGHPVPATVEGVIEAAKKASPNVNCLIENLLGVI